MRDATSLLALLIWVVLVFQLIAFAFLIWLVSKVQTIFRDVLFIRDDTLSVLNICEFLRFKQKQTTRLPSLGDNCTTKGKRSSQSPNRGTKNKSSSSGRSAVSEMRKPSTAI